MQIQREEKPCEVVQMLSDLVVQLKRVVHRNQVKVVGDQEKWRQYQVEKRIGRDLTTPQCTTPEYVLNERGFPIRRNFMHNVTQRNVSRQC